MILSTITLTHFRGKIIFLCATKYHCCEHVVMNNGKWEYWGKSLRYICVCVCIKLKTYSAIQEMNFWFLLQVGFFFLANSGRRFCSSWVVCGFIVLCWRKYERYEQLCLGAEKSKLIRAVKLLWPNLFSLIHSPLPCKITQNLSKISVVVYKDS